MAVEAAEGPMVSVSAVTYVLAGDGGAGEYTFEGSSA